MNQQELEDRLLTFSVNVIQLTKRMPGSSASINLLKQLSRSAPAACLIYGEACAAESRKDFVHKMGIGLKELKETKLALRLVLLNKFVADEVINDLINENDQLIRIFGKSISTAKRNRLND